MTFRKLLVSQPFISSSILSSTRSIRARNFAIPTPQLPVSATLPTPITTTANSVDSFEFFKADGFSSDPRAETFYATLPFINEYGWSNESLIHGVRFLGYPSVAHGLFPGGEAGLIDAYLCHQRQAFAGLVKGKHKKGDLEGLTTNEKVLALTSLRLKMNRPYIKKWPEAIAIMARPSNIKMSLRHLFDIADDIWYYAGDKSSDMNWYAKRGSLAAIYSASEMVMIKDSSFEYRKTHQFLKRRLKEAAILGASRRQATNVLYFGAKAAINAISSIRK